MTESVLARRPESVVTCDCLHPAFLHDAVASRYCASTKAGALSRTCICAVGQDPPARSYDRR